MSTSRVSTWKVIQTNMTRPTKPQKKLKSRVNLFSNLDSILTPPMLAVARTKAQKIEQLKVDTMKQQIKVGDQPRTCLNSKGGMVGSRRGKASNRDNWKTQTDATTMVSVVKFEP